MHPIFKKKRSFEKSFGCYANPTNDSEVCLTPDLFEKTENYCKNMDTTVCQQEGVSDFCMVQNGQCVLKDTGMMDLVE